MKLLSLRLQQFRQHQDSLFEFQEGITGIVGPNGSGKTTIVEAIAFALYGSKAIRGKLEDLPNRSIKKSEKLSVSLLFEVDGSIYRIERGLNEANIYFSGNPDAIASGNKSVVAEAQKLIGMSHDEFVATYFTEQKGLEFLGGKKGATERERFVLKMMGLDRLQKIQQLLRQDKRDLSNTLTGLESALGDRSEILKRIESEKNIVARAKTESLAAEKTLNSAEKESAAHLALYEKLGKKEKDFAKLDREVSSLEIRVEEVEKNINRAEAKYKEITESFNASDLNLVEQFTTTKRGLEADIQSQQEMLEKLFADWRESQVKTKAELAVVESKYSELKKKELNFEKLGTGNCPTCEQELGGSFEQIKKDLVGEVSHLEQHLNRIKTDYDKLKEKPNEIIEHELRQDKLKQELQDVGSKLRDLEKLAQKQIEIIQLEKEIEQQRKEKSDLSSKAGEIREMQLALNFSENEFLKSKTAYETAAKLADVARLQKTKIDGELQRVESLLERTQSDLENYDAKSLQLKESKGHLLSLEEGDRVLTDFRKHLNATIRPRLAELAGEFLAQVTDGRYTAVDIGVDFTPTVIEDGEVKAIISGGEEDILNICVRLALSHMLAERAGHNFSFLILDEVFGSLDENRRNNVIELLDRLRNRFEQIILITHVEEVKEIVEHMISVQYDESQEALNLNTEHHFEAETVNL